MLISLIEGCQIAFLLSKHSKTQTYSVYSYQRKDRMARTINRLSEWIISALITKQVFLQFGIATLHCCVEEKKSSVTILKILKMIFTLSPSLKKISRIFLYKNTVDEGESSHLVSNYAHT